MVLTFREGVTWQPVYVCIFVCVCVGDPLSSNVAPVKFDMSLLHCETSPQLWIIVQIALPSIMIRYGSVLQRRDGSTHPTDFWWKVQIVAITLVPTNKLSPPLPTHTPSDASWDVLLQDTSRGFSYRLVQGSSWSAAITLTQLNVNAKDVSPNLWFTLPPPSLVL